VLRFWIAINYGRFYSHAAAKTADHLIIFRPQKEQQTSRVCCIAQVGSIRFIEKSTPAEKIEKEVLPTRRVLFCQKFCCLSWDLID